MAVIGPAGLQQCEKRQKDTLAAGSAAKVVMPATWYAVFTTLPPHPPPHPPRPITAHPAAAVQRWGVRCCSALDYVLQEINQIIWCYAVKVESCHMCPRSCILHDFVLFCCHQRSVAAQPRFAVATNSARTACCVIKWSKVIRVVIVLLNSPLQQAIKRHRCH